MTSFTTWLQAVEANEFDDWTQDRMIREMPHTHFVGFIPSDLEFLRGAFVDLGFENLGLTAAELRQIMAAFGGNGVGVPGNPHRLRHGTPGRSVVEAADGSEQAALPPHWRQGVLVVGDDDEFTWIGKRVRSDQIGQVDMTQYEHAGEGWTRRADGNQSQE